MSVRVFSLGSLFSGIGGLELGLEMTGRFETVWQVEQNEYCRKVLARHWPNAKRFVDVREVGKENLTAVDVICGGFPCQDISHAGRQAGIVEGNRSGLWHEYARVIRELRPDFVIVENVAALLTRGLDIVLGDLARIGYDAEWRVLSAADVGAPHLRRRVFVLAYPNGLGRNGRAGDFSKTQRRRQSPNRRHLGDTIGAGLERHAGNGYDGAGRQKQDRSTASAGLRPATPLADADNEGESGRSFHAVPGFGLSESQRGHEWWSAEPNVGRVAHGVPHRVDRLRALGNAVVPQCARVIGEWLLEIDAELNEGEAA